MKSLKIPYRQENHKSFDAEWPVQRKVSGWWYITGYFSDLTAPTKLYSYQFTVIKPRIYGISPWIFQLALTDVANRRHRFTQRMTLYNPEVYVTADTVQYLSLARLVRETDKMVLLAHNESFDLILDLDKGKGTFWHGDNGVLVMGGAEDPHRRTVYYSYTNMPTTGIVTLHDPNEASKTMQITGKSWFDRQWGPYALMHADTHWEWFSLRFFDDEEVMLFSFPQCPYYDGTYINQRREQRLVRNYTLTPKGFTEVSGMSFSMGWDLTMPGVKQEKYEIRPLTDGQLNLAYFELLAGIYDSSGTQVGLCMVELLPGARNPQSKIKFMNLFKKVS
jgi:predicted secreted hydrolase